TFDAASAITWLFVPGDRPEGFEKAARSGADAVIIDLEAAVDASRKIDARKSVRAALEGGLDYAVRINASSTEHFSADLEMLAGAPAPAAIVLSKAERADDIEELTRRVKAPVVALIESALGLHSVDELASLEGVVRLAF